MPAATAPRAVRSISDVTLTGGGGTDLRVGIDAALAARPAANVIVAFTDGGTPWPDRRLPVPLIVALIGKHATDTARRVGQDGARDRPLRRRWRHEQAGRGSRLHAVGQLGAGRHRLDCRPACARLPTAAARDLATAALADGFAAAARGLADPTRRGRSA